MPVAQLAKDVHVTPRQLQRDFSETLGISPRQYGQEVRARRAATSLRSGACRPPGSERQRWWRPGPLPQLEVF